MARAKNRRIIASACRARTEHANDAGPSHRRQRRRQEEEEHVLHEQAASEPIKQATGGEQPYEPWLRAPAAGGPMIPDLLISYEAHIARFIWQGEERGPLKVHLRTANLEEWQFDDRDNNLEDWARLVMDSGLLHLRHLYYEHIDSALISAFVERWHPETNTFHMPWGEMTITLHDVAMIMQLPIEGEMVVALESLDRRAEYFIAAERFGLSVERVREEWRRGGFKNSTVRELASNAAWRTAHPDEAATLYLLYLLGSTLFIDKSQNYVPDRYLSVLYDVRSVGRFAWGVAALAFLYRRLGEASRRGCRQISGCITLLQAWIYVYFPTFRGSHSTRRWEAGKHAWAARWEPNALVPKTLDQLQKYRRMIDHMLPRAVMWQPYGEELDYASLFPTSLFHGTISCMSISEPYMPDRVSRQFGRVQHIPRDVIPPATYFKPCRRPEDVRHYKVVYEQGLAYWATRPQHSISLEELGPPVLAPWDASPKYDAWFCSRTHPRVHSPLASEQDHPTQEFMPMYDIERRVQTVASMMRPFTTNLVPPGRDVVPVDVFYRMQQIMVDSFSILTLSDPWGQFGGKFQHSTLDVGQSSRRHNNEDDD